MTAIYTLTNNSIGMKRLFTFLCMVSLLLFHASCNEGVMELESSGAELKTRATEEKVQNLIQQARYGDADAYNSLALCYRDGDGVDKSYFNMLYMYANYCMKTGNGIDRAVELFEEGNPFRLITEILVSTLDENTLEKTEQLTTYSPTEAKAINAAIDFASKKDAANALTVIREAENEGSELAALIQIAYYKEKEMKDDYEQCLFHLVEKYPFLNLQIGELYIERYWESKDFSDIQKAMEYYYKADAYAMLTSRYACGLISIYKHFRKKGLLSCDEHEMERLKNIANINNQNHKKQR